MISEKELQARKRKIDWNLLGTLVYAVRRGLDSHKACDYYDAYYLLFDPVWFQQTVAPVFHTINERKWESLDELITIINERVDMSTPKKLTVMQAFFTIAEAFCSMCDALEIETGDGPGATVPKDLVPDQPAVTEKPAAKPKAAKKEEPKPEPVEDVIEDEVLDFSTMRAQAKEKLTALARSSGSSAPAIAILKEFGVESLSKIPDAKLKDLLGKLGG